jgi:site-specific recombinase XerD
MYPLLQLKEEYKLWLKTLGFAESSVKSLPQYIEELLSWLESKEIREAAAIREEDIQAFFLQWKKRKNKTSGAGLSIAHTNKGALAINNFVKFLHSTGKNPISLKLEKEQVQTKIPVVLSLKEISALYEATYHYDIRSNNEAYGQRDRAMLAVYYACGLRKNEGNHLAVNDILREKQLIHVRKGKGSKERYVPVTERSLQDITEYLSYGRPWFLEQRQKRNKAFTEAFFVNIFGGSMKDFTRRIRILKELAGLSKNITLHTLRHSIATHLLQSGMDIEQIRKFLGHSSLESTQIYTHILHEF